MTPEDTEATERIHRLFLRKLAAEYPDHPWLKRDDAQVAMRMTNALASVLAERERQDAKWGEQNLDPFTYLAVLTEEVGELAQAALHTRFGGPAAAGLRDEAVHVAAVALAIVECLDRGTWRWPQEQPKE